VGASVGASVGESVDASVGASVVGSEWWRYFGGQCWVGGWWWSPSGVSYVLDVCGLELEPSVELAARAHAATCMAACWWWPGREVVTVSERPHALEFHDAGRRRLKRVAWDGWEVTR
jgi:hypothetical protein